MFFSGHYSWYPEITLLQNSSVECVISHTNLVFVCHSTHPMLGKIMSHNSIIRNLNIF